MLKSFRGSLAMVVLLVIMMLAWTGGAEAVSISACQTLSAPGTYVLTAHLTAAASDCFVVAANSVTIDLNGFLVTGDGSAHSGVTDGGVARTNTVVRGGTIRGFGDGGTGAAIDLQNSTASVVDRVIVTGNVDAILVGPRARVRNSTIYDNDGNGITIFGGSGVVTNNTIYKNSASGVAGVAGGAMTVTGNTIVQNGLSAILVGSASTVTDNVVLGNGPSTPFLDTISAGPRSLVSGNTVLYNTGDFGVGIRVSDHSTVRKNVVNKNKNGFFGATGIRVADNGLVVDNTVLANGEIGIDVTCPSTVKFNTALGHSGPNIWTNFGAGCVMVDNIEGPW